MEQSYHSYYKAQTDKYIQFMHADNALLSAWMDDVFEPQINIMMVKTIVEELLIKMENKELTREVLKPALLQLQELSQKLDQIAMQNATAKLRIQLTDIELAEKRFNRFPERDIKAKPYTGPLLPRIDNL